MNHYEELKRKAKEREDQKWQKFLLELQEIGDGYHQLEEESEVKRKPQAPDNHKCSEFKNYPVDIDDPLRCTKCGKRL